MALNKKSVDDLNAKGRRVLVRCDFNVPLKEGKITDEGRQDHRRHPYQGSASHDSEAYK